MSGTWGNLSSSGLDGKAGRYLFDVLDAMPVAVALVGLQDGEILFLNRKLTQIYGYRRCDVPNLRDWAERAYPMTEQRDRAARIWSNCASSAAPAGAESGEMEIESLELDIRCSDGSMRTAIHGGMVLNEPGWVLATFVDITDRKRDELLFRQLAEEDVLTGLPNRRAFEGHLKHAVADAHRDGQAMHLLLLDLDHFKAVNDRLGHHCGDLLLQAVAERLKAVVRGSDVVARFGGDEFAIILRRSGTDEAVARICDKILRAMHESFALAGEPVSIGISIGISRFPKDATTAQGLFEAADRALYRVKDQGRGHWRYAMREA